LKGGSFDRVHVLHKANQVAYKLANYGLSLDGRIYVFDFIHPCCTDAVMADVFNAVWGFLTPHFHQKEKEDEIL